MSNRLIWIGVLIGSTVGGYVPTLFGAGLFSMWGVVGSTVGGIAGVLVGHRLGQELGL